MALKERLRDDLKQAMRQKDEVRKRTLRMALAEVKNREIEIGHELNDDQVMAILDKEAKRRRETLEELERVERPQMAVAEQAELEVLKEYLPRQLSRQEIAERAAQVIADLDAQDMSQMSQVMNTLMSQLKGKADGKLVSQVVRELLSD